MSEGISYLDLVSITFQATLQTVVVCFFGYLSAVSGLLPPRAQRYISQLNVQVFTPCLIFSKLASSLSLKALVDISVIPIFFAFSTLVTFSCSKLVCRIFNFNRRESNFVTAMGCFGNSNSLPVSITVALAYTLPNLEWDDLPNDNKDDIASRGILYLLIFQQLGQVLRWSWGYNTLLAKPTEAELIEEAQASNNSDGNIESQIVIKGKSISTLCPSSTTPLLANSSTVKLYNQEDGRLDRPPLVSLSNSTSSSSLSTCLEITTPRSSDASTDSNEAYQVENAAAADTASSSGFFGSIVAAYHWWISVMNPPLWAMLVSIMVGATPAVKHEFFYADGFLQHTVTEAIRQLGGIAIPLILVVLGSNLAPDDSSAPPSKNYTKLIVGSLLSRIFFPSMIILPMISLCVKFLKISIFDDPIFLLVAFVLTIAPPAIQLSQICQLNKIFEKEMAGVLFWGYVVVTLPSTIFIVVLTTKVLEWVD
jgi:predicted permease